MVLSEDLSAAALFAPVTAADSIMPRTKARYLGLAHSPSRHAPPLGVHPPAPPHTYFPRCVLLADGTQLGAQSPRPLQAVEALQTITRREARGFRTQAEESEAPRDIGNNAPLVWIDIPAAARLIVFFLEQSWKSLKRQ